MITPKGYKILTKIYDSPNSIVYQGIRQIDNQKVIIKVLKQDYPKSQELTRYKQEYNIVHDLNIEGVIKAYSLETCNRTLAIIFEDIGASSLKELMNGKQYNLRTFLKIAIKITKILGNIHRANIIHKDINPSNIILNPETGIIKIIDFGISTKLNRENPTIKNPNILEGTLSYISPEQTGRINRSLDYRTDFYSLGIAFYEMLTGCLPFTTEDSLELVHCHLAKMPPELGDKQDIPQVLSDIVMKLMAKTAESRYQSPDGLKVDLENCLYQLETTGNISYFSIASQDISEKLQISQKLYGREKEVKILLSAFERVSNSDQVSVSKGKQSKSEMMLVAGYSGIGKSVLVQEIYKPITEKKGYFISGKFDQLQRHIPYSAIANAFKELVRYILTESETKVNQWRNKIVTALGANTQVIIDVIPEIELIVGKQQPVPELGLIESQNRFNLVFPKFIRAISTKEHPLVIFLDDLQWVDAATIKLIKLIMIDSQTEYLFLIGADRDNEVNSTHPLIFAVEELKKEGAIVNQIRLTNLDLKTTNQLIADTLHRDTESVENLAKLVKRKTRGNPFFINQFLNTLQAENLIKFNWQRRCLQWEIAEIEEQNITENVVDLMIKKLKPYREQDVFEMMNKHIGVCYLFDQSIDSATTPSQDNIKDILTPEAFATVPAQLLENLLHAAKVCDAAFVNQGFAREVKTEKDGVNRIAVFKKQDTANNDGFIFYRANIKRKSGLTPIGEDVSVSGRRLVDKKLVRFGENTARVEDNLYHFSCMNAIPDRVEKCGKCGKCGERKSDDHLY